MTILTAYYGVVEKDGLIRLRQAPPLPEGTEVVVVVAQPEEDVSSISDEEKDPPTSHNSLI